MSALTQSRPATRREASSRNLPVAKDAKIYQGALVALNDKGLAVPATKKEGLTIVGCAQGQAMGGAVDGEQTIAVRSDGAFLFNNASGADAVNQAEVGKDCYALDDQTVTKTKAGASIAGKVFAIDDGGAWITFNA